MSNQTIRFKMEDFLDEHNLHHGNAEVIIGHQDITMSIEAPQHTVMSVYFNQSDIEQLHEPDAFYGIVTKRIKEAVEHFDVDAEFDELWSPAFRDHNGFKASQFIRLLESDKRYFEEVVSALISKQSA